MFARDESGGAGEFKKPGGVAEGYDRAEDALRGGGGATGEIYRGEVQAVGFEVGGRAGELGGGERGELDLAAPAVDVGEIAADVAGERGDGKIGSGASVIGDRVAAFAHGGGGFVGPMGGGTPAEAWAFGGGDSGVGHGGSGGVGGGRWGGGLGGIFFLGDAIGRDLGVAAGGEPKCGEGK